MLLTQIAANCGSCSCKNQNLYFGLSESNLGRVIDHIDCDFSLFPFLFDNQNACILFAGTRFT